MLKKFLFLVIFTICCLSFVSSTDVPDLEEGEKVQELDSNNFNEAIAKYKNILIAFYSSASDITSMNYKLLDLAKKLLEFDPTIYFVKCKLNSDIRKSDNAPRAINNSLKINFVLYTELNEQITNPAISNESLKSLDVNSMMEFIKQNFIKPIYTLNETDRYIRKDSKLIFLYFTDNFNSEASNIFKRAARSNILKGKNMYFVLVEDSIAESFKKDSGDILVKKRQDEGEVTISEGFTEDEIINVALLHERTMYNNLDITKYSLNGVPMLGLIREKYHSQRKLAEENFRKAYLLLKKQDPDIDKKINFVILGFEASLDKDLIDFVKITTTKYVRVFILDTKEEDDTKWKSYFLDSDAELTHESIKEFVENYLNGYLLPHVNSEDISLDMNYGPGNMNILVAKNFDKWVIRNELDVLILFFREGCRPCDVYQGVYMDFWEKYQKDNKHLFVAALDAVKNDNQYILPEAYPEVWIFKKNEKDKPRKLALKDADLTELTQFVKFHVGLKEPTKTTQSGNSTNTSSNTTNANTAESGSKDEM